MKTLKSILLGAVLLISGVAAKADNNTKAPAPEKVTKNYVISTFVNAISHGQVKGFNDIIDRNAKFSTVRGNKLLSYTKDEMINYLKTTQGVDFGCTTSSSVVESNADYSLVKVDMQFDGFVRTNYVTIANTGEGWKITDVYSVTK